MKEIRIRFNPTGNVFVLPEDIALETYRNSRDNYTILEEDFVDEEQKVEETTVYQQIVEEEISIDDLKAEANKLGIKYAKNIGIDTLKKRIEEYKANN